MTNINYSYEELVHYLDLTATDPVVRRLVNMLNTDSSLISGLIEAGMNTTTFTFEEDYQDYTPGEYIEYLEKEVQSHADRANDWEWKYDQVAEERDQLKVRSIAQVLHEMEKEVIVAKELKYAAERNLSQVKEENKELKDKINVWQILEKE